MRVSSSLEGCVLLVAIAAAYLAAGPRPALAAEPSVSQAAIWAAIPVSPAPEGDRRLTRRAGVLASEALQGRWAQSSSPQPCAQPRTPRACCDYRPWFDDCGWGGSLGMLGWLPGMSGTLGAGPVDMDVDISIGDLLENIGDVLENLEFGWQGEASVRKGRWMLTGYVSGLKLGQSVPLTVEGASADIEATVLQWQANLYYRAGMSKLGCSPCPTLLVYEPYVGIRGYSAEIDFKTPGPGIDTKADWVDPVVGARLTMDFRNRWALELEGDVGGFGVGSDLSWLLRVGAGWRIARKWTLGFGWIIVDTDYEDGAGLDRFKWDLHQSGPYLGIGFSF